MKTYKVLVTSSVFILTVLAVTLFTVSCGPVSTETQQARNFMYVEWNGHRYVQANHTYMNGITHDPDCPKCTDKIRPPK